MDVWYAGNVDWSFKIGICRWNNVSRNQKHAEHGVFERSEGAMRCSCMLLG